MKSSFLILFPTLLVLLVGIAGCGSNTPTEPARPWDSAGSWIDPNGSSSTLPAVAAITPSSGVIGAPVVITGVRFGVSASRTSVYFDGTRARIDSMTSTTIFTHVPSDAQTGAVIVVVDSLSSPITPAATFTVAAPPGIQGTDYASASVAIDGFTGTEDDMNNGIASQTRHAPCGYATNVVANSNQMDDNGLNSIHIVHTEQVGNTSVVDEVIAHVDPSRNVLAMVAFLHHQVTRLSGGDDPIAETYYTFQMLDLPYMTAPDGALQCSLSGTALATRNPSISLSESHSQQLNSTKRISQLDPIGSGASVSLVFRRK